MLGQSSNLRPNLGAQSPRTRLSEEPFPTAGSCPMYHPPPRRGRSLLDGKKVLLIDEKQTTRETRANVVRGHLPGEALEFYEQIREVTPRQLAFLVGPPLYLSLTWPGGISLEEASRG